MYHFSNHQLYHQNAYQQQCPMFVDHTKHNNHPVTPALAGTSINQYEIVQHNLMSIQPENTETQSQKPATESVKKKVIVANKGSVDTSNFSIEERLVAAVWVHERRITKSSISQIKQDFRQRFGREPPAKNTLLVWERKLFSTGSVHDAPRPGRPIHRHNHMEEVKASVQSSPALSLRARALALRLPRTTLRTILNKDLSNAHNKTKDIGQNTQTGKHQTKRNGKRLLKTKPELADEHCTVGASLTRRMPNSDIYT